jgi:multidrug efflux system outer membrane protein
MSMRLLALLLPATLAACSLAPEYKRPDAPIPAALPSGGAYPAASAAAAGASWKTLIQDQKLAQVIDRGIAQSRDLRYALAQVESARALYGVQRASQLPAVGVSAGSTYRGGDGLSPSQTPRTFDASLGFSAFEIDLFGRLRNQSKAAFESYLATEAGARSTRITLVSEIAAAYVTYAYDLDVLRIGEATRDAAQRSFELTTRLLGAGLADRLDVAQSETVLRQAESDIAASTTQVAKDRNALELLVGAPVEEALLPASLSGLDPSIRLAPAGLSSDVLLSRPDVLAAEARLKAANANIGAARAAFFPRISLTAAIGVASPMLKGLFDEGNQSWSASPSLSQPIFSPAVGANLDYTKAQRDAAVANYEGAVQSAFREVSDALARQGTIARQRQAQTALVQASQEGFDLATQRYQAGIDPYIDTLTAQRTLDSARRSAAATILSDLTNRLTLYRALGGATAD